MGSSNFMSSYYENMLIVPAYTVIGLAFIILHFKILSYILASEFVDFKKTLFLDSKNENI